MLGALTGYLFLLVLEALLSAEVTAIFEHVSALRMKRPEGTLARLIRGARHLDETVVEAERVPDGVLPALLVLPVERKEVHDELVDLGQSEHPRRRVLDGHGDEADVRIGRFGVCVVATVGFVLARALHHRVWRFWLGERAQRVHSRRHADGTAERAVCTGGGSRRCAQWTIARQTAHARGRRGRGPRHARDRATVCRGHATATHGCHADGRAHVEGSASRRLGAAIHGHVAHGIDGAVRRGHAAHVGHGSAAHGPA